MEHNASHISSRKGLMLGAAVVLLVAGLIGGYFIGNSPGDDSTSSAGSTTVSSLASKASATEHNDADISFTQDMVPHHTQATEMAKLAETRASSPQVKALAAKIAAAQQPEIDKMNTWLAGWGANMSTEGSMAGMDHGGSSSMSGMMSEDDMTALAGLSGAEFDKSFLTMMTAHHTGAISMAEDELKNGKSADALALASSIQVSQQAEVNEMKALLN